MTLTKGFARNSAKTPLDQRLADAALIAANADGSSRVGVLYAANPSIVTALATMYVAVAAAQFVTSKGVADGVMIFTNDGTVNVAISAAPASNSRITVIWVKHNDDTTGDADALPVFGTTDGSAAAFPTKPAIPTGALELATLRVYAGTTAANGGSNTLTNTYQMTAMRGADVPFRTKTELLLWTNPVVGQRATVYDPSTTAPITYKFTSAAWIAWESDWITGTGALASETGGLGSGTSNHRYKYVDGMILDTVAVTISSAGSGGGALFVTLPVASLSPVTALFIGSGRSGVDGSMLTAISNGATVTLFKYNNTTPIGVGSLTFTILYQPA